MKKVLIIAALVLMAGCAGTYKAPTGATQTAERNVTASKQTIMTAAKIALATEGFQITMADDGAGIISTAPLDLKLSVRQANCGTTMGLNYLEDNRTSTRISFNVIAVDGAVRVRAAIQGEYRPGAVDQDMTLSCISYGVIEQDLLDKIVSSI